MVCPDEVRQLPQHDGSDHAHAGRNLEDGCDGLMAWLGLAVHLLLAIS